MDATSKFTAGVETLEGLALRVENLGLVIDFDTTHGEMEDGLHESNVKVVVDVDGPIVEELFAIRILLLACGNVVVLVEGPLELLRRDAYLLGELLSGHLLHETTA